MARGTAAVESSSKTQNFNRIKGTEKQSSYDGLVTVIILICLALLGVSKSSDHWIGSLILRFYAFLIIRKMMQPLRISATFSMVLRFRIHHCSPSLHRLLVHSHLTDLRVTGNGLSFGEIRMGRSPLSILAAGTVNCRLQNSQLSF